MGRLGCSLGGMLHVVGGLVLDSPKWGLPVGSSLWGSQQAARDSMLLGASRLQGDSVDSPVLLVLFLRPSLRPRIVFLLEL